MSKTPHPRGAAAKTRAAIRRGAAEDKGKRPTKAELDAYEASIRPAVEALVKANPIPADKIPASIRKSARPSILEDVKASASKAARFAFNPEQESDIAAVRAEMTAGRMYISATGLARVLRARYDLAWHIHTIRDRLVEHVGGKW
jgi:hypothetical protein